MTETTDLEAFKERLRSLPQRTPRAAPDSIPRSLLAWLALAPVWPDTVATREFPLYETGRMGTGPEVELTLAEVEKQGLVKSGNGEPPWRGRWYWMERPRRMLAIEQLLTDSSRGGVDFLREELARIGRVLTSPPPRGYPPAFAKFTTLAQAVGQLSIGQVLDREVSEVLESARMRKNPACPEAKRWLEQAEPLVPIFGDELRLAVERARRRLELFERRSRDERYLLNYTERPALEQAFVDLLDASAEQSWALHYLGDGGMGKTMLIRRIATHFAEQYELVTSRIDFDHINPDYPSHAPGLLLMALAEDLKLHEDNVVAEQLRKFDEVITSVHRSYEGALREDTVVARDAVQRLDQAERLFIEVLRTISARSQSDRAAVVLILDTCEELARLRPDGVRPEAVEKTFALLERLHAAVPKLRVVFSGRRRLAESGAGWTSGLEGTHRKFLRRAVVGGFDVQEANSFLAGFGQRQRAAGREQRPVGREYWTAIKTLSEIATPKPGAVRTDSASAAAAREAVRFNPYDLDLYASWAASGSIDPDKLPTAGVNFFVRERIVQRVSTPIRTWLPVLARLGMFDRSLLIEINAGSMEPFADVVDEITAQEWIDPVRGAQWSDVQSDSQAPTTWRADPNIAGRLARYYVEEEAAAWADAERRLLEVLPALVIERPWREITLEYIVVALELLEKAPERALVWWDQLEARLVRDRRWNWGLDIVQRLRDRDWADVVSAAQYVTEAALRTKMGAEGQRLRSLWDGAVEALKGAPGYSHVERLRYRARAGAVGALRWTLDPLDDADVGSIEEMLDHVALPPGLVPADGSVDLDLAASELGVIDNTIETLERIEWSGLAPQSIVEKLGARIAALAPYLPESAKRFIEVRDARLRRLGGQVDVALTQDIPAPVDRWMDGEFRDWSPPQDWSRRVMLERIRLLRFTTASYPGGEELGTDRNDTLDFDRAASARLLWESDHRRPDDLADDAIEASLALNSKALPRCYAHRDVPPLFQVALEVRADHGRGDEVLALCSSIAEDSSRPLDVRRAAERVKVSLATGWRLRERGVALQTSLETSTLVDDRIRVAGAAAYDPKSADYTGRWVAVLDQLGRENVRPEDQRTAIERWHCWVDRVESGDVPARSGPPAPSSRANSGESRPPEVLIAAHWGFAAELREWALGIGPKVQLRCGQRLAAKIATEEAGLLAIRRPIEALRLLEFAAARFKDCDDSIGSLLCAAETVVCHARADSAERVAQLGAALESYEKLRAECLSRNLLPASMHPGAPAYEAAAEKHAEEVSTGKHAEVARDDIWVPWATRIAAARDVLERMKNPGYSPAQFWTSGVPPDMRWLAPPLVTLEKPEEAATKVGPLRWLALLAGIAGLTGGIAALAFDQVVASVYGFLDALTLAGSLEKDTIVGAAAGLVLGGAALAYVALAVGNRGGTRLADMFRRIAAGLSNTFFFLLGLSFIFGGIGLLYKGFDWVLGLFGSHPVTTTEVTLFIVVLLFLGSMGFLYKAFTRGIEKLWRVTYTFTTAEAHLNAATSTTDPIGFEWGMSVRTLVPNRVWPIFEKQAFELPSFDETMSYAERGEKMPMSGEYVVFQVTPLLGLSAKYFVFRVTPLLGLFAISTDVEVIVPTGCGGAPWEALIATRWLPRKKPNDIPLRFRRTSAQDIRALIDESTAQPSPPFSRGQLIVSLITRTTDAVLLRDQWQKVALDPDDFALSVNEQPIVPGGDKPSAVGIVHVLDEILLTERGLALRVGDATQLFATEVVRRWPDLRLVILQSPWRPDSRRFGYDRLEAERARLFAAQLFEAGVPAVLVLPSMPQAMGLEMLKPLIELVAERTTRAMPKLNRVVHEMRKTLAEVIADEIKPTETKADSAAKTVSQANPALNAKRPPAAHMEQLELAAMETPFDVCLYCRSDLSLAIEPAEDVEPAGVEKSTNAQNNA